MGHRAEEHLGMQHMRHLHIGYVFELTGDLDLCVPHREAASNHSVGRSFTAHMFCVLSCILVMRCACAQRPGGWPPRSSHIPCSGTGCWRSRRGSPPQRGPEFLSRRALADITMPGVQYPHWTAPASDKTPAGWGGAPDRWTGPRWSRCPCPPPWEPAPGRS